MEGVPGGSMSSCKCFAPGNILSFLEIDFRNVFFANMPIIAFRNTY